jgi:hypothetical protein
LTTRPDHPDFWLISQTLIDNDTAMDQAVDKQAAFKQTVNAIADIDSVQYAAEQRVLRIAGSQGLSVHLRLAMESLWMDAFVAGAYYHKLKTEGGQSAPERP